MIHATAKMRSGVGAARKKGPAASAAKSSLTRDGAALLSILLAAVTFAVYGRALGNDFVSYDDPDYITRNTQVLSGLSAATLRWAFTTFTAGNWHPLTWISHATDVQIFGFAAWGHHLVSTLLHTANSVLLFLLLWKATASKGRSWIVAALFALHPLNVECVAWAAERKSVLSTLFFLLAVGVYGLYVKRGKTWRYALIAVFFALGLMAKPMVITLPFVLLLLDYWPLGRTRFTALAGREISGRGEPIGRLVFEKLPLLALSAASAIITIIAQRRSDAVMSLTLRPMSGRIENALVSYVIYLFKMVWPSRLAVLYLPSPPRLIEEFLALLLLVAISAWVGRERRERPYLLVGWLFYLGTLVPVIGIFQVGSQSMADRYAYLPLIGIFVMLTWTAAELANSSQLSRLPRASVVALTLIILSSVTVHQIGFWKNSTALWSHTAGLGDGNFIAEDNLGLALLNEGALDQAQVHFENALHLMPTDPKGALSLANILLERDPRKSIAYSQMALSVAKSPIDLIAIYTNLGVALEELGDYGGASENIQKVVQLDPSDGRALLFLGSISMHQSAQKLEQSLELRPTTIGFNQLGDIWSQLGEADRARKAYQAALALDPTDAIAKSRIAGFSPSRQQP